jgi:hypothetical protein
MAYCVYVMFIVLMILNAHNIHWRFYIVIKITNCAHTDSPPLSVFQKLVSEKVLKEAF